MSKDKKPLPDIDLERAICLLAQTAYRTALRIPDHMAISVKAWNAVCRGVDVDEIFKKHDAWYRTIRDEIE